MSTRFFTNNKKQTLFNKFKGVFENNRDIKCFDALVGYFRASGYFAIRPYLEQVPNIRILVGINVDKLLAQFHSKGLLFKGDGPKTVKEFLTELKDDIQQADYDLKVEEGILQFVNDIINRKIEVRAHPHRNLHAKIYIFRPENWNEHRAGHVITGSSNFTDAGIGNSESSNYEFNVLLNNYDDVEFATEEFNNLWRESVPVLPVEIEEIKKKTFLNDEFSPFELYIKFLIEYFGNSVEFDPNSITDLPKGFKRLSYQIDAVNEGYKLIQKHNGFFLSDVVGLGKTIVAILIAKKFFYANGFPSHLSTTLIVIPPALKSGWTDTLERFQLKNYEIITNGSLHKIKHPEKYDLIIVDEAHKFRNDTADAYDALQRICKSQTRRILPNGTHQPKKVILMSATPLNNRPEDIANQIYLFQDAKDSTLEVSNLQHFFRQKIDAYKKLKTGKYSVQEVQNGVKYIYESIRNKVIAPLTVRRTRTDLRAHKQYWEDIMDQGILFPDIEKPKKILYKLDPTLEALYDKTMFFLSDSQEGLFYFRYQAIKYLVPEKKQKYSNADLASTQLAKIMKTLLVKRIDSSFHAFYKSLNRFLGHTQAMLKMFEKGRIYIAPSLKVSEFILEDKEDELIEVIASLKDIDQGIEICVPDDFYPEFIDGLKRDLEILESLVDEWANVEQDPKFDEFLHQLNNGLLDKQNNPQQKLVVFSESKETTAYLVKRLKKNGFDDILEVNAGNRNKLVDTIQVNFDANIERTEYKSDYNIIISTEVLAEGVNLHRSNTIVNYDTPWNSTRLMQRIGRVNRIGSVSNKVYVYNFFPTAKVNTDIELEKKAVMKLQAFHSALGEDSQIYSADEEIGTFGLFDKNVEEERDEKLNLLMELRKFKEENPEMFRKIKNMPLRARVGRKDKIKKDSTICFIRNNKRDAFYWIKPEGKLEELTFVEAAHEFRADVPEKSLSLHDQHHDHVKAAIADFDKKIMDEAAKNTLVDTSMGPNEKRAIKFLDGCLTFPFISEDESNQIKAAKQAIKIGKFQKLHRNINTMQKNLKKQPLKPVDLLDALLKIIRSYPLNQEDTDGQPLLSIKAYQKQKPEIIISESYSLK
ncbi:helicase-related protein [Marinilabilia salmonicolor]|uniref:Phospholipase D-like protein n=1 Tax=Marinilabilia salmonicolor TaxID=989 RepID=A0A368V7K1_9BACT|nr:helicase-related protein [Marinilabilia salmonicolor]RCW36783.1 phospholipase D-like protein [Marinilabilia salmonicolor]